MGKQMNPLVLTGFPHTVFKLELAQHQGWTTGLDVPDARVLHGLVSAGSSRRAQSCFPTVLCSHISFKLFLPIV